jgi:PTS system mannose-specific IIB component
MMWFRIDNRLVHGQIIEAWLPYLDAGDLVVVNTALAGDALRQEITRLAVPERVRISFVAVAEARKIYDELSAEGRTALFLVDGCADALRMAGQGIPIPVLNVGNMHYCPGKRQLCAHVAASDEEIACLRALKNRGAVLDFRCVPSDAPRVEDW